MLSEYKKQGYDSEGLYFQQHNRKLAENLRKYSDTNTAATETIIDEERDSNSLNRELNANTSTTGFWKNLGRFARFWN